MKFVKLSKLHFSIIFILVASITINRLYCQEVVEGYFYVYPNSVSAYPNSPNRTKSSTLNTLFSNYDVVTYRKAFPGAQTPSIQNAYEIHFTGDLQEFRTALQASEQFSRIEVAPYYRTSEKLEYSQESMSGCVPVTVNDPNADWVLDAIEAECAWSITTGDSAISVAIVDTEFDATHPDLTYPDSSSKLVTLWLDEWWDTHTLPNCPHGTQVAGMAVSQPNNGVFTAGIGYNTSLAGYIPRNSQLSGGGCSISPWNGVWQAYLDGQRIINVSATGIGGPPAPQTVVDAVTELTSNGSLLVVAAGSSGCTTCHSQYSNIPGVINVSGLDSALTVSSTGGPYSQFVDICAPSIAVQRIRRVNDVGPGWGTSLAAPIVAGTAALMIDVNSCLEPAEIESLIKLAAEPISDADEPSETFFGLVGAGRLNAYKAVRYASGDFDDITNDLTWNSPMYVNGNIRIKTGTTLTITSRIRFGNNVKITVERGAQLIIDGGHLTAGCSDYWQGIEVLGNPSLTQSATNQGVLELKNDAIIEYANNAITTGTNGVGNQGGGIIKADNTTFRNNRRAVEFMQYNIADNQSYFTNCTFELTNDYPQTTYIGMVTIWDNYGIPFTICTFRNQSTSVSNKQYGIYTIDAGYAVASGFTFEGFTGGVFGTNSSTSRTFSVSGSTFSNNAVGVYAGSVNNVSATGSTFNVGQYSTGSYNYGVYLNTSTGYTVESNSFTGHNPSATLGPAGVFCLNTGDANNVIRENSYTNLYVGNYAVGDNRNNSIPSNGLRFLCNLNNANASYDFSVVNYIDPNVSGIATPQGSALQAAGNTFSLRSTPTGSDYRNATNYSIQYYYQNVAGENPMNTTGIVKTLTGNGSGCTSFLTGGGEDGSLSSAELATLQNEYNVYKAQYDTGLNTRNNKLDDGNTASLLAEVDQVQRGSSDVLEDKLLGISPWLSAEVLKKILDKRDVFQENFITKILKANPEALFNATLQRTMEEVLSAAQLSDVRAAQSTPTERSALESRLADAGVNWSVRANAIIRHYLVTEPVDMKKVREWLYNKNDVQSHYQIVESWLQEQNTVQAQKALSDIGTELELTERQKAVYEDYQKLTDLKIKAMDEGRTIADFTEVEVAKLVELADRNLGRAGEQARGILNFFYGYHYVPEQLILPDEAVAQRSSASSLNELATSKQNIISPVQVVPNPASSEATFKYNLTGQEIQDGVLQIVDINGKILQRFELQNNAGEFFWNMNGLQPGIYFYSLRNNGRIITFGRLAVVK